MLKQFLILIFFLLITAQAQLFDSIGGTLKGANLGSALGTGAATPTPADISFLSYIPDPAISEQVITEFVETLKSSGQTTPEQAAQLETVIRENINRENMQKFIDELFAGEGFKLDNLADVLAIYFIASFVVLNDLDGTSTEQDLAVRNQIINAFGSVPEIKQLSDADKQKTAEALILFTIFLANDWQQAQQGVEGYDLNTVKTYTKDTLLQMGIDSAQFDFTPTGLVRKGNTPQGGTTTTPTQITTPDQTTTPNTQTTTPTNLSPYIQTQVDAMTPEELQAMLPQCQQFAANPDAANGIEKGSEVLALCQAVIAKASGTAQTQQTQENPLGGTEPAQNPLNPLQPAAVDPFAGNFSGQNMALTLSGAGTYTGQLTFNGQTFPVTATFNGQTLTGTFNSGGTDFEFSATLQDKTMTLQSGGSNFILTKTP